MQMDLFDNLKIYIIYTIFVYFSIMEPAYEGVFEVPSNYQNYNFMAFHSQDRIVARYLNIFELYGLRMLLELCLGI